ncbi:uracil-DNA glycosylase [Cyanobium sp. WAJ14-Wanaka]|uniref:uracil-DNA glycosylase n=1 Tax=Cyanobium sp. WAJ14-Wanaka TaxID=2823725 RepID=UPI0020CC3340|nr:uracil-DNA glycosylase [Cyanobium sp. WAJ14-Wanaka]
MPDPASAIPRPGYGRRGSCNTPILPHPEGMTSNSHLLPNHGLPDLGALTLACGECQQCSLAASRQQVVVGRGNPEARLMLIGEAPGAEEDATGLPFVGRSGLLLDQLLAEVGLDRDHDLYICNGLKCRPPANRKPKPAELEACRPWLEQQISLVNPAVIGLVGATALAAVMGIKAGISQLRGQWLAGEGPLLGGRALMPLFHPSYLLRNPSRLEGKPRSLTVGDLARLARRISQ